jgi:hypothetical protein
LNNEQFGEYLDRGPADGGKPARSMLVIALSSMRASHHLVAVLGEQAPALAEGLNGVVAGPLDLAGTPGDNRLLGLSVAQRRLA